MRAELVRTPLPGARPARFLTIAILCGAVVVTACRGFKEETASASNSSVVARFSNIEITAAELDRRILALPPAQRPLPGQDLQEWHRRQIQELVIEALLRDDARDRNVHTSERFRQARHLAEKQLVVQRSLMALRPELRDVSEEEIASFYAEHEESLHAPERRATYHIFLRTGQERPVSTTRARIEALRDRVLRGESFLLLAEAHSDSESRHKQGYLGWLRPGELPPKPDAVVFSLDEGVPSDPVVTGEGVHIFYVDQIIPERKVGLDEARPMIEQRVLNEHRRAAMEEIAGSIEPPSGAVTVDRSRFEEIIAEDDPEAVVLRVNDSSLVLGDLRQLVRQAVARQEVVRPASYMDLAWELLESRRRTELIYEQYRTDDTISGDDLTAELEAWEEQALVHFERGHRLREIARRHGDHLRDFYSSNIGQFSTPPRWRIRRLRIPLDDKAQEVMARLEEAARANGRSLEELRDELGGTIEALEPIRQAELHRLEPKLPPLIAPLAEGELSPPYRTLTTLEIAEVVERNGAEPIPFDEVRDRVLDAYVQQHTSQLYEQLRNELLATADLEIVPEGLRELQTLSAVPSEISVEQLEALFEKL
jgi:parvulin-like peptidyl-prolyl isomerase